MSQGRIVESLTANGVTVQVSLQDTGWKLRASLAISNQGAANLDVMPTLITLDELQPSLRLLPSQNPAKIANAVNHQSFWTIANARLLPVPWSCGKTARQPRKVSRIAPPPRRTIWASI